VVTKAKLKRALKLKKGQRRVDIADVRVLKLFMKNRF
jgi:hypothetical protein